MRRFIKTGKRAVMVLYRRGKAAQYLAGTAMLAFALTGCTGSLRQRLRRTNIDFGHGLFTAMTRVGDLIHGLFRGPVEDNPGRMHHGRNQQVDCQHTAYNPGQELWYGSSHILRIVGLRDDPKSSNIVEHSTGPLSSIEPAIVVYDNLKSCRFAGGQGKCSCETSPGLQPWRPLT